MLNKINWEKCNNLVPAVIQNTRTLEVLMLGYMNQEALDLTEKSGKVHFWSRTKNRIWMKGEESGNILNVASIHIDCDADTLLILVNPMGNTCHKDITSCFDIKTNFLNELEEIISNRMENNAENSYISNLAAKGINKIVQKIGEEATEVVIAMLKETDNEIKNESADLLFHLLIGLKSNKISVFDVIEILKNRHIKK